VSNRATLLLIAIFGILLLAFHATVKKRPGGKDIEEMADFMKRPTKWQGKLAPDFEAESLDGGKFKLSEQVGRKVVILNFFATWCEPCNAEMPELAAYFEKHRDEPFTMIAIDADEKNDKVREFVKRHRVGFPAVIDRGGKLQELYGVRSYPTTVFIGTDGIIHVYQIGPVMNGDVAFDSFYRQSQETLRSGKGITPEAYLRLLKEQEARKGPAKEDTDEQKQQLTGRAKSIAERMTCPCGCDHKVAECGCKTAKGIRESLAKRDLSGKTDLQVIKELNKEFCEKDDNC
jgi:peroxiredoxin